MLPLRYALGENGSAVKVEAATSRAPARPGPDLRRRRQRPQPARGLARPRDRRDPARVLGARASSSAGSAPARCAGSARGSPPSTDRRSGPRASASCRGPTPSTTRASRRAATRCSRGCATGWRPRTRPTTGRRCTSSATTWPRWSPRGRGARLPGRASPRPRGHHAARDPLPRRHACVPLVARRRVGRGLRPLSDAAPAVAPGSRTILALGGHEFSRKRGNEAMRDYMLALADGPRPRICLLPTASGDPADQIAAFRRSLGGRHASSPTSRCSGSRPRPSTSPTTCSPRT